MSRATGCVFTRIMDQGDTFDQIAVKDLIASNHTHVDVARSMTGAGYPMSEHAVRRHRKSDCSCNWAAV